MDFTQTNQKQMEDLYSKHQLNQCIKQAFLDDGYAEEMTRVDILVPFGLGLLVQMVLHKRATVETLVGILRRHFEHTEKPAQACADALDDAAEKDLVDWDPVSEKFILVHDISNELKHRLDILQYPLPMIEPPQEVRNNRQTGYQTIHGSLLLRDNHHDDDICLDHINRVNSISLSLNADVVAFVQNHWKGINRQKPGENYQEFRARKKAFQKYNDASADVLEGLMFHGNRFWLTHKYDKRGRTYCQGYHVNPQGNDWNKACVELADAEKLNEM
jgi:Schitoviridae RNA polymerase RNAP1 subunit B